MNKIPILLFFLIILLLSTYKIKAQSRDTIFDYRKNNGSLPFYSEYENSLIISEDTLAINDYFFCDVEILNYSKKLIVIDSELKYKNVYATIPLRISFHPVNKETNKLTIKEIDFDQINIIDSINLKTIKELSTKDTSIFFSKSIKEDIVEEIYKELILWKYNLIHSYSSNCELVIVLKVFLK